MQKKSNYETVREAWQAKFLTMDHESLADRFHLKIDAGRLYLTYFSRPYAIDRKTAQILRLDSPGAPISFGLAMNFFNMFHYAVPRPRPSGTLIPFRQVKRASPFESAYRRTILEPFQQHFTGRVPALQSALAALHATPLSQGDAGGLLEILPGLRLAVTFWDADEEFPAQSNMLFDANITDYFHEENVVTVASDAAGFLVEEAEGNEQGGNPFF